MHLFNFGKEKMMMRADFDLNTVQIYTDSVKEVLKQTMLNQDVVFRNQVHELHRLYRVQESLMKDFGWKDCNGYSSWSSKAQSSLLPLTNSTRYRTLAKETRFSSTAEVASTPFVSQDLLKDSQGTYHNLHHRPLDLHLSADEFINSVEEDIPMKGNCSEGPVDFKLPISGSNSTIAGGLNISLSIGGDNKTMIGTIRTCFPKKTYPCSQNVIDLEESVERIPDEYAECTPSLGEACLEVHSKGKHESQASAFSGPIVSISVKKDLCHEIAESSSLQEYSECCQEQTFSGEGIRECRDDVPSDDLSTKMPKFTSCRGGQLDLNKVHLDDSSCCSEDHMLAYPSTASSEGGSHGLPGSMRGETCPITFQEKVNKCLNEASGILKQDNNVVNLLLVDFNKKNKSTDMWTRNTGMYSGAACLVGSEFRPPVGISENLGYCSGGDNRNDSVELKSKLSREVSYEKSELENALFSCTDQSQNSMQDGHGNKSPASCKSYCISDNDSSSAKTKHFGITSGVSNQCLKIQLQSQVGDITTGEHSLKTSESRDIKNGCCSKKEESAKADVLIQQAAELLIQISTERSACDQDSHMKEGSKEMADDGQQKPQCSFDSFELMALNLTESNLDDNSVSSKPIEVTDMETKEFGIKYRRGRRMKDFQKEILPTLSSLSRHEILEDINIMEGVLRSREYRKFRAKMAAQAENRAAPVRSRRSRLSHGGRRNF